MAVTLNNSQFMKGRYIIMLGSWKVDVAVGTMPEKVATAFGKLGETLIGAEYTPIAYLGCQLVNGVNHAVLAEQLVLSGKDTKNIVVVIFNEKVGSMDDLTLVNIERVVEGGAPMGGTQIDVKTDIPVDAKEVFDAAFDGWVGSNVEPFALLATQVVNGINYVFVTKVTSVTLEPQTSVDIVVINSESKEKSFNNLLTGKQDAVVLNGYRKLGYAFTW